MEALCRLFGHVVADEIDGTAKRGNSVVSLKGDLDTDPVEIADADGDERFFAHRRRSFSISRTASSRPVKTLRATMLWPMLSSPIASISTMAWTF